MSGLSYILMILWGEWLGASQPSGKTVRETERQKTMELRGQRFLGKCICFLSATLLGGMFAFADEAATLSGKASVIDGDNLKVGVAPVRLHGIDAPETGQLCERPDLPSWRCDEAAANRLVELAEGRFTICSILEVDRYGRLIATCEVKGIQLGPTLVKEGLAWAFTKYSQDYVPFEQAARRSGLGIWQNGAEPQTPADYRADRWARAAAASPVKDAQSKAISPETESVSIMPLGRSTIREQRSTKPQGKNGFAMRPRLQVKGGALQGQGSCFQMALSAHSRRQHFV
ncbi:thermonuclease family protein [Pseudophaeobacter sp.]|uniref:thermonuclease family protein n=1 Tax=Pseudophaeobacter sp. TaxID=1971739 RepID=UPI003297F671